MLSLLFFFMFFFEGVYANNIEMNHIFYRRLSTAQSLCISLCKSIYTRSALPHMIPSYSLLLRDELDDNSDWLYGALNPSPSRLHLHMASTDDTNCALMNSSQVGGPFSGCGMPISLICPSM